MSARGSEIAFPFHISPRTTDPVKLQKNLDTLARLFMYGQFDGDVPIWSEARKRYVPGPVSGTGSSTWVNYEIRLGEDNIPITVGKTWTFGIPIDLNGLHLVSAQAFVTTVDSTTLIEFGLVNTDNGMANMLATNITIEPSEKDSFRAGVTCVPSVVETAGDVDIVTTGDQLQITPIAAGTEALGAGIILSFDSVPGGTGAIGPTGNAGENGIDAAPFYYQFNTATSGNPGSGKLLVNNATIASATVLFISETDDLGNVIDALLATLDDSTSAIKAHIIIRKVASTTFAVFEITGVLTDLGAYDTFPVTYVVGAGSFSNNDPVTLTYTLVGDEGPAGPSDLEYDYVERTTTLSVTPTSDATAADFIVGNAVAYDGSTRVRIEFCAPYISSSSGQAVVCNLYDGSTDLGRVMEGFGVVDSPGKAVVYITPTAATHTYKWRAWKTGGTASIGAGGSGAGAYFPAFMRISKA